MKKNRIRILRNKEWQIKEKLMLKERKIYIPKNKKLSTEIIKLYYNILITRYGGR